MTKRIHFPLTTAQQRRLLFETWEATGDVMLACRTAHVGRRTFYYWKPRFITGGYAALVGLNPSFSQPGAIALKKVYLLDNSALLAIF